MTNKILKIDCVILTQLFNFVTKGQFKLVFEKRNKNNKQLPQYKLNYWESSAYNTDVGWTFLDHWDLGTELDADTKQQHEVIKEILMLISSRVYSEEEMNKIVQHKQIRVEGKQLKYSTSLIEIKIINYKYATQITE